MVHGKVEEVLFWFGTYNKWFQICNPESLNLIPDINKGNYHYFTLILDENLSNT